MRLTFDREIALNGRLVSIALAAEIIDGDFTSHGYREAEVSVESCDVPELFDAAEDWAIANDLELSREALREARLLDIWA